ncbi:coenzyme F420-0:L-glutamate ligase [Dethiobacter alkaliphilus]|uniref:Asparagine synthase (Glutamine-hydrolyzing) n=1 Tax=Dethiobacter alkaliphilus AHT 1 TaxID=555088 RepID=C0GII2_DETAL|nr:coenzyme F420-0:L-glutamate ligase [Dethiobacter alkaliphilus]EEG76843.1 asparagine synthase (glutamine-hydrolyzing) [Dethiobacter alkaliphilus AHT 1]
MSKAEAVAQLKPNAGRELTREVDGQVFLRYPIRTHFVEVGEDYFELVEKYVLPYYQDGDILSISEKIITLCQGNVLYKSSVKIGLLAKILAKFVMKTPRGERPGNLLKMQTTIDLCGPWKVLFAAFLSAIGKLFGKRGIFYSYLGNNINAIDGFNDVSWEYYGDKGLLGPIDPDKVCQDIREKYNIDCMIVDANNIGVEVMGVSNDIPYDKQFLAELIMDNPAGQGTEQTPFILIRKR